MLRQNQAQLTVKSLLLNCLLWFLLNLGLPILFVLWVFLASYKKVIILLSKVFKLHELACPVEGLDVLFSTDDYWKQPHGSLGYVWFIEGPVSPNTVKQRLETALLSSLKAENDSRTSVSSVNEYEKLTSVYPTFWMGFPFWKKTGRKLDISSHIKVIGGEQKNNSKYLDKGTISTHTHIINNSSLSNSSPSPSPFVTSLGELNRLICDWMAEPFAQGQPLWEIRMVPQIAFLEDSPANLLHPDCNSGRPFSFNNKYIKIASEGWFWSIKLRLVPLPANNNDNGHILGLNKADNTKDTIKSIFILKTHHVLGDGISMLRFLEKLVDPVDDEMELSSEKGKISKADASSSSSSSSVNKVEVETESGRKSPILRGKLQRHKKTAATTVSTLTTKEEASRKEREAGVTDQEAKVKPLDFNQSKSLLSCFTTTYICSNKDNADVAGKVIKASDKKAKLGKKSNADHDGWWCGIRFNLILLWRQLSNAVYFTFFIPSSILTLLREFAVHEDSWFTKRKETHKMNLATITIPLAKLNKIRKDVCKEGAGSLNSTTAGESTSSDSEASLPLRYCNDNEAWAHISELKDNDKTFLYKFDEQRPKLLQKRREGHPVQVPIVVLAVSALAGALRRLLHKRKSGQAVLRKRNLLGNGDSNNISRNDECLSSKKGILKLFKIFRMSWILNDNNNSDTLFGDQSWVNFVTALPLKEEHPGKAKFCNFWTHGILKTNLLEENPVTRLFRLNKYYWDMRSRQSPEIYYSLIRIYSLFPKPILSFLSGYNIGASIGVTNMADSTKPVFIGGKMVSRKYAYFGLQWKHASLTLALLSYNGEISVTVLANDAVIRDQKTVEKLLRVYLSDEVGLLSNSSQH